MSHANPQIDVSYLNDFITTHRKKNIHNAEFQRRKLLNIAHQLRKVDSIEGQLAEASVEFHFCNYEIGIRILKNVLKLTQNQLAIAWDLLLDAYIQLGDLDNIFSTYNQYVSFVDQVTPKTHKIFLHIWGCYFMREDCQNIDSEYLHDTKLVELISDNVNKLESTGVSLQTYRNFVSLIFKTFYSNFKGTVEQNIVFNDNEIIIRVSTTVDNASDLFELNSKYNDQVLNWYSKVDNHIKDQIDKVTVYYMYKDFNLNEVDDIRVMA